MAMESTVSFPKAFSVVQQRRVWVPLDNVSVCPSMDLVALLNASNHVTIHRLFTWDDIGKIPHAMHCCWRPDGRILVTANNTSQGKAVINLYSIEGMLREDVSAVSDPDDEAGTSIAGCLHSIPLNRSGVTALCWAHVNEMDPAVDEEMWSLRFRMLGDVVKNTSPMMDSDEKGDGDTSEQEHGSSVNDDLPSFQTPLSVLAVVTGTMLHIFAHGRYPIVQDFQLPIEQDEGPVSQVVASSNLVHWVLMRPPDCLCVVSVEPLYTERYNWQALSTLHCQISQLISGIKAAVNDVINLWQTTLKQLDWKLDGLDKLFAQYHDRIPACRALLDYSTNSNRNTALANAADQFFTSAATNDQLLQRLERSLLGSLANVEKVVERQLLEKMRALARAVDAYWSIQWDSPNLSSSSLQTEIAAVTVPDQDVMDCLAWLRGTGAARRAKGTPPGSTQRHNALQRRLTDAQLQRMVKYWRRADQLKTDIKLGTTERLLGLTFREHLEGPVKKAIAEFEQSFLREHSNVPKSSLRTVTIRLDGGARLQAVLTRSDCLMCATIEGNTVVLYRFSLPVQQAACVKLTCGEFVADASFCGNDGKSTLDPTSAGPEGSQKLAIITHSDSTRLWLFEYDSLPFTPLELSRDQDTWLCAETIKSDLVDIRSLAQGEGDLVRVRSWEKIEIGEDPHEAKLSMSGSRGIGIVYTREQGGSVEVLDLEDHEGDTEEENDNHNDPMEEDGDGTN